MIEKKASAKSDRPACHALSNDAAFQVLNSGTEGLTEEQGKAEHALNAIRI